MRSLNKKSQLLKKEQLGKATTNRRTVVSNFKNPGEMVAISYEKKVT